jgi:L,D-transpeptidase YcbB
MNRFPISFRLSRARRGPAVAALLALFLAPAFAQMLPTSMPHYTLLQQALARYRILAADPTLTQLPALPARSVKPGEPYPGGVALRRLLTAMGDLSPSAPSSNPVVLDGPLVEALRHFQHRHGLTIDGVIGRATFRALTTPLAQRVRQIERTLHRWEQLPANPGSRTLFINIPQFRLIGLHSAQDTEAQMLRMDVVVGRDEERLRTPTMVTELTDVIFHPYWDVPASILRKELLPQVRANPKYLEANNLEIVSRGGAVLAGDDAGIEALAARPGCGSGPAPTMRWGA